MTYQYYLTGSSSSPKIGLLKKISSTVASTEYNSYDALGQVMASTHTINGYSGNLTFSYDYYLSGGLKSIQDPSGRTINHDVDDASRTNKAYNAGKTYADLTAPGITAQVITRQGYSWEQSFVYDGVNRLWNTSMDHTTRSYESL